jgi:hypothetical protein
VDEEADDDLEPDDESPEEAAETNDVSEQNYNKETRPTSDEAATEAQAA